MTIITSLKDLVQPTSTVEFPLTLATEQIIQNIFHTLANRSEAIGVAANQIGYDCRIFVMHERQVGSNGIQSRKRCKVLRNVK